MTTLHGIHAEPPTTGWLDILSLQQVETQTVSGFVRVMRVGPLVLCAMNANWSGAAPTYGYRLVIPSGYRPTEQSNYLAAATLRQQVRRADWRGDGYWAFAEMPSGDTLRDILIWPTTDPMPA